MAFQNGKRAAVSLTYDDGLHQHLDHAIPHLETTGFRGTFYIHTRGAPAWEPRAAEWAAAAKRGHEIGNHSQHHPCSPTPTFKPRTTAESYTLAKIEQELRDAEADIEAVVPAPAGTRSYAYPCGVTWVGPERNSYRPIVKQLFTAARGGGGLNMPGEIEFDLVHAVSLQDSVRQEEAVGWIDQAIDKGAWLVFVFHGIEGAHLSFSGERHQQLLAALQRRAKDVHVDTFIHVARQLQK